MENVTDRVSNPFGMRPPCPHECPGGHGAVFGYGDANADVHVVGDRPEVHGGVKSGIPFTGAAAGERVLDVLETVGLLDGRAPLVPRDTFFSYLHCCCSPPEAPPTDAAYADLERFFDAELRAIAADVLVPVGRRATAQVLREYTGKAHRLTPHVDRLHGRHVRGRGFLVVPIHEPGEWGDDGFEVAVESLSELLATDYHQMVDLGRFLPDDDPYLVR